MPAVAAGALARGVDSPSLRELAGLNRRSDTAEICELYRAALAESGIEVPGEPEAVRWVLRGLAEGLVAGGAAVAEVVREVPCGEVWMTRPEYEFAHLAYYREELDDGPRYERDLLEAARALLGEAGFGQHLPTAGGAAQRKHGRGRGRGKEFAMAQRHEIRSTDEHENHPGETLVTTEHDVISNWARERGAEPATVPGTERDGRPGVLRLDFPGYGGQQLKHLDWDEWFRTFDERGLRFIYQEHLKDGKPSNFFRLENPNE
ncbi:hypothetical protein [Spongiactinospora gelatinilytica]|nr:hypothetical protein [Spongiactinospora gelatinilytica]